MVRSASTMASSRSARTSTGSGARATWRCRARRNASGLPVVRNGSRSAGPRAVAAAAIRASHGSMTRSGTSRRRSTDIAATREPVGLAAGPDHVRGLEHPVGDHVEQHGELVEPEVRRRGQLVEHVGAVGDGVRPALAGHEAAGVALAHQPAAGPVAPLEQLAGRQERRGVVAVDAHGQHQRGEAAPEDRRRPRPRRAPGSALRPCRRPARPAGRRTPRRRPRSRGSG